MAKVFFIRAVALIGYGDHVRRLGGNPEPLLLKLDLPLNSADYPRQIMSCHSYAQLLEDTAAALAYRGFALDWAKNTPPHYPNIGPLAMLGTMTRTFAEWVEFGMKYWNVHCNAFTARIFDVPDKPDMVTMRLICAPGYQRSPQLVESVLANIVGIATRTTGHRHLRPRLVRFRHPRPDDISLHEELFRCNIEFDADCDEFQFERRILALDTNGSLRMLRPFFERYIRTQISLLPIYDQTMRETTQAALDSLLGTGKCTIDFVAASLGMSAKKLQRLLASEGTNFSDILSAVRRDRACKILQETDVMIADIARLLDYAALGAFSNAFVQWMGMSPSEYRRATRPR